MYICETGYVSIRIQGCPTEELQPGTKLFFFNRVRKPPRALALHNEIVQIGY